jgi:hypothetical protein
MHAQPRGDITGLHRSPRINLSPQMASALGTGSCHHLDLVRLILESAQQLEVVNLQDGPQWSTPPGLHTLM